MFSLSLPSSAEQVLWRSEGVLLTDVRLVAGRRSWALRDIQEVEVTTTPPSIRVPLAVALGVCAVALPLASGLGAAVGGEVQQGALVLAGLTLFAAIFRLVQAEETHWLVVRTPLGPRRAVHIRDARQLTTLLSQVRGALARRH
jgi:hypothetical protein